MLLTCKRRNVYPKRDHHKYYKGAWIRSGDGSVGTVA